MIQSVWARLPHLHQPFGRDRSNTTVSLKRVDLASPQKGRANFYCPRITRVSISKNLYQYSSLNIFNHSIFNCDANFPWNSMNVHLRVCTQNISNWCRHLYSRCASAKYQYIVGLPCLVSQCAKLNVAGWTWAVFTSVYLESCTWSLAKQQRVDVCTEIRQLASDNETILSRITGDLVPCDFFLVPKLLVNWSWKDAGLI
jgi:hypothetical protein